MIRIVRTFPVILAMLVGAGCSTTPQSYEGEDFAQNNTFFRAYPASGQSVCDAGRRALLSQGYNIDKSSTSRIEGRKNFQTEDGQHTQISFNIDCSSNEGGDDQSTVFANAVQDRYSIKKSSNSASVGLSVLGSVSMPIGSSADSLVKTASQTITRPKFYDGFFALLERFLPAAQGKVGAEKADGKDAAASHGKKPARGKEAPPVRVPDPPVDPVPSLDPPDLNDAAKGSVGAASPAPASSVAPSVHPESAPAIGKTTMPTGSAPASVPTSSSAPEPASTTPASTPTSPPASTAPASSPTSAPVTATPASAPASTTPASTSTSTPASPTPTSTSTPSAPFVPVSQDAVQPAAAPAP